VINEVYRVIVKKKIWHLGEWEKSRG
jgi:hypothetical protein